MSQDTEKSAPIDFDVGTIQEELKSDRSSTPDSGSDDSKNPDSDRNFHLIFLFGGTIFASAFCFAGFMDIAPTSIFNRSPVFYDIIFSSSDGIDMRVNVSTSQNISSPSGFELPPQETFTEPNNLGTVGLFSLLSAILTSITYSLYQCCNWQLGESISPMATYLCCYIPAAHLHPGLAELLDSALVIRVVWFSAHSASILVITRIYSSDIHIVERNNVSVQVMDLYIRNQWRRMQTALTIGVAVAFGGAVTFAPTSSAGAIPVALLAGTFFMPAIGAAAFYFYRVKIAEEQLGI